MKDTNPDHYKVDGADFLKYMDDPQIKGFGDWMFANGYNVAEMDFMPKPKKPLPCPFCGREPVIQHDTEKISKGIACCSIGDCPGRVCPYWHSAFEDGIKECDCTTELIRDIRNLLKEKHIYKV